VRSRFTATIDKLTFDLEPAQVTAEEEAEMQKVLARARD
jgi:hypothetical protein